MYTSRFTLVEGLYDVNFFIGWGSRTRSLNPLIKSCLMIKRYLLLIRVIITASATKSAIKIEIPNIGRPLLLVVLKGRGLTTFCW